MKCPRCGLGIDISHLRKRLTKEEAVGLVYKFENVISDYFLAKSHQGDNSLIVATARNALVAALTGKEDV